jgi:hypothetical protein
MRNKLEVKIHESEALNGTTTNLKIHVRELDDRIRRLQRRNRRSRGAAARAVERLLPIATGMFEIATETKKQVENNNNNNNNSLTVQHVDARRAIDIAEESAEFALEPFFGDQDDILEDADEFYDSDVEFEKKENEDNDEKGEEDDEEENGRRQSQMHLRKLRPQVHAENAETSIPVYKALKNSIDSISKNNISLSAANAALQAQFAALQAQHTMLGSKAREVAKVAQAYAKQLQETQKELRTKEAAWDSKELEWADAVQKLSTKLKNEKTKTRKLAEMLRAQPQHVRSTRSDTLSSVGGLTADAEGGTGVVDTLQSSNSYVESIEISNSSVDAVSVNNVPLITSSSLLPESVGVASESVPHLHRTASAPSRIDQPHLTSATPPATPSTLTLGRDLNKAIAELEFSVNGVDPLEDDAFQGIFLGGQGANITNSSQQGIHASSGTQNIQSQQNQQQAHQQHQQQQQQQQLQQLTKQQQGGILRQTITTGLRTAFSTGAGSAPDPRLHTTVSSSATNNNLNTIMANSQPGRIYVFAMAARNLPVSKHTGTGTGGLFSSGVEKINALAHSTPSAFLRLSGLEGQERVTRPVEIADRGKDLGGCAMFHTLLPLRVAGSLHKSSLRVEVVSQRLMRGEAILGIAAVDLSMLVDWPGQPHAVWVALHPSDSSQNHHQSEIPIPVEASIVFSPEAAMVHLNASKEGLTNSAASSLPALFQPAPPTAADSDHWASKVLPPAPIDGHPALLLQLCYVRAPPTTDRPQFFTNAGEPPPDVPGTFSTNTSVLAAAATVELEGGAGTHHTAITIPAEDHAAHHNPFAAFSAPPPPAPAPVKNVSVATALSTSSVAQSSAQSFASSLSSAVASALAPPPQTSQPAANSINMSTRATAPIVASVVTPVVSPPITSSLSLTGPPEADVFNPFAPVLSATATVPMNTTTQKQASKQIINHPSVLGNTPTIPESSSIHTVVSEPSDHHRNHFETTISESISNQPLEDLLSSNTTVEIVDVSSQSSVFASTSSTGALSPDMTIASSDQQILLRENNALSDTIPTTPSVTSAQVQKLTAQINVLKTAVKSLRVERTQIDSTVSALQNDKDALLSELSVLKEGKSTLDAAYAGLLSRKMQWAEEKDNAMDEKAALEAKSNELKKELDTIKALLEQDRKAATIEKDNSAAKLTKSEAVIAEKDIKIRKIETSLTEKDKEKDILSAKVAELQTWNKNAMVEGKNLLGQVNKLTADIKSATIERETLTSKITILERQVHEAITESTGKEKARIILEAEVASIERSRATVLARCERLEASLAESQIKLEAFAKAAVAGETSSSSSTEMHGNSAPSSPSVSSKQTMSIAAIAPATPSDLLARNEMTASQMAALKLINELRSELDKIQLAAAAATEVENEASNTKIRFS